MRQVSWERPFGLQEEGSDALKGNIKGREPLEDWRGILKKPLEQEKEKIVV